MSVCENANIFVGRALSHDIKPALSVSALAPEDPKRSNHTGSESPVGRSPHPHYCLENHDSRS